MAVHKNKIIVTVVLILVIAILATVTTVILLKMGFGVSPYENSASIDLSTDILVDNIIEEIGYKEISQVSSENISKYYDLDDDLVSDVTVYISDRADSQFEISCFRLTDDSRYSELESIIKSHLNLKNSDLKKLNPKESKKIDDSRIEYCNPYVLVVVADNSSSAVISFQNFVLGKSEPVEK